MMKKVCNFAHESPSDEILPRPSQPQKLAIFFVKIVIPDKWKKYKEL